MTIHPFDPLKIDFLVDNGDNDTLGMPLKKESTRLVRYFMTALTVPQDELWVNLSPYEKDRIISLSLGQTEMGRDLLAQDYMLKQLASSLMYPENALGKKFWVKVYSKAQELFGTTNIPINTINKIWIVPDKAVIYRHGTNIFITQSRLKVMLQEDYLALKHRNKTGEQKVINTVISFSDQIMREILIPQIEKEVNEGANFAMVRQMYNSVILATWYKNHLQKTLLGKYYVDQNKVKGIDLVDKNIKEKIYRRYITTFKRGVFNFIKEEYDPFTKETIPRKYFSGGANLSTTVEETNDAAQLTSRLSQRRNHLLRISVEDEFAGSDDRPALQLIQSQPNDRQTARSLWEAMMQPVGIIPRGMPVFLSWRIVASTLFSGPNLYLYHMLQSQSNSEEELYQTLLSYLMDKIIFRAKEGFYTVNRRTLAESPLIKGEKNYLIFGDLHGDLETFLLYLWQYKFIDRDGNWRPDAPKDIEVGTNGDLITRGLFSKALYWYIHRLQDQARATGRDLFLEVGNHDLKESNTKSLFLKIEDWWEHHFTMADHDEDFDDLELNLTRDMRLGRINIAQTLNNVLVIHAGTTQDFLDKMRWSDLSNQQLTTVINSKVPALARSLENGKPMSDFPIGSDVGPLRIFERDLVKSPPKNRIMLVGHTPTVPHVRIIHENKENGELIVSSDTWLSSVPPASWRREVVFIRDGGIDVITIKEDKVKSLSNVFRKARPRQTPKAKTLGGIDLSPSLINLEDQNSDEDLSFDATAGQHPQFDGLIPVITRITPLAKLPV